MQPMQTVASDASGLVASMGHQETIKVPFVDLADITAAGSARGRRFACVKLSIIDLDGDGNNVPM